VRIKWLRTALQNLEEEAEYIARDSPASAVNIVTAIIGSVNYLSQYPAIGRPGRVSGTRELVISGTPYIVPYRVRKGSIEILRVFHGARRGPDRL
jgi:toxin ParE1/3/4